MAEEQKDYKAIAEAYEEKEQKAQRASLERAKTRAANWLDLANHFQAKVLKRTSEVVFLQTKAGFLIAAGVVDLQIINGLPKLDNPVAIGMLCLSALLACASLIVALISMHMTATNALKPQKMITDLSSEKYNNMSREMFGRWLAASYAKSNDRFNKEYSSKYKQQVWSACLLVASFILVTVLKGVQTYA
jgi:hypothetical protein